MSYRHVAIIIPIYNELDNILTLIDLLLMEVPGANIFIVDDNSPDGSALAIEKSFGNLPTVSLGEIKSVNPLNLLNYKYLVITNPEESVKALSLRAK